MEVEGSTALLRRNLSRFEIKEVRGLDNPDKKVGGEGSYGAVYEVTVNGQPCYAKQLHGVLITPDILPEERQGIYERFYKECLMLSGLNHDNIVKFVGVHFSSSPQRKSDVALIMEKLDTDLSKYLRDNHNVPLLQKLTILLDVSEGLLYLHTRQPAIIHRDLTTGNILLTTDLQAKIADFGVSRALNISPNRLAAQTKCPGTLAYMPPEALQLKPVYGKALDIFSFGEVCLCTIHQTFAAVFDVTNEPDILGAHRRGEVEILKRKKWLNDIPPDHCLRDILVGCLRDKPDRRPTTQHLNDSLSKICVKQFRSVNNKTSQEGKDHNGRQELARIEAQYKDLERQHRETLASNQQLKSDIQAKEVQALTYKMDFEEERKDRASAHSKLADLQTKMVKSKNAHEMETGRLSEELKYVRGELTNEKHESEKKFEVLKKELQNQEDDIQAMRTQVRKYKEKTDKGMEREYIKDMQIDELTKRLEEVSAELADTKNTMSKTSLREESTKRSSGLKSTADRSPMLGKIQLGNVAALAGSIRDAAEKTSANQQIQGQDTHLDSALREIEQLREGCAKRDLRIVELERRVQAAEGSAQPSESTTVTTKTAKNSAVSNLTKRETRNAADVAGFVTKMEDYCIISDSEAQLRKELQEKEEQRYRATQLNISLQDELHKVKETVISLENELHMLKETKVKELEKINDKLAHEREKF